MLMKADRRMILAIPGVVMLYDIFLHLTELTANERNMFYQIAVTPVRAIGYDLFWAITWTVCFACMVVYVFLDRKK
jgi:hypothetical protein